MSVLEPSAAPVRGGFSRGGLAGWQRKRVSQFIEEHLTEDVTLDELAAQAELSRYHFSRAFKQSFGLSPLRYHARARIEFAKCLLAKRAVTVTQIGQEIGFSETSAFTTAFRRSTGMTPTGFRRAVRNPAAAPIEFSFEGTCF